MSAEWSTTVTAFTITRRGREWLMIRHERLGLTSWEVPGGHVDPGETMEQAAARESFEETGVSVDVGGLLAVCVHEWDERRARKLICFFDATTANSATPRLSPGEPDIHEVAWLDPSALSPEDVSPFLHPLIQQPRLGRSGVPLAYSMVHRRNSAGLWAPAPSALSEYRASDPILPPRVHDE
jgi:8-oxo-dGTP diphosphatase